MLQTCCTCPLWSARHSVVQYSLVVCLDIRDLNALTYAFLEFIYKTRAPEPEYSVGKKQLGACTVS